LSAGIPVIVAPTHRNHWVLGLTLERLEVGFLLRPNGQSPHIDAAKLASLQNRARTLAAASGKPDGAQSAAIALSSML
jgi:hypothetical protein